MSGPPGEDSMAAVTRPARTVFQHVDGEAMSQAESDALWDSLYELAGQWALACHFGPSTHSAIRLGMIAAADAKRAVPREPQCADVPLADAAH